MKRFLATLLGAGVLAAMPAGAGHELSFYPSFYPQEIRIETHGARAELLEKNHLHAYVGADPFAGAPSRPRQDDRVPRRRTWS